MVARYSRPCACILSYLPSFLLDSNLVSFFSKRCCLEDCSQRLFLRPSCRTPHRGPHCSSNRGRSHCRSDTGWIFSKLVGAWSRGRFFLLVCLRAPLPSVRANDRVKPSHHFDALGQKTIIFNLEPKWCRIHPVPMCKSSLLTGAILPTRLERDLRFHVPGTRPTLPRAEPSQATRKSDPQWCPGLWPGLENVPNGSPTRLR